MRANEYIWNIVRIAAGSTAALARHNPLRDAAGIRHEPPDTEALRLNDVRVGAEVAVVVGAPDRDAPAEHLDVDSPSSARAVVEDERGESLVEPVP